MTQYDEGFKAGRRTGNATPYADYGYMSENPTDYDLGFRAGFEQGQRDVAKANAAISLPSCI